MNVDSERQETVLTISLIEIPLEKAQEVDIALTECALGLIVLCNAPVELITSTNQRAIVALAAGL